MAIKRLNRLQELRDCLSLVASWFVARLKLKRHLIIYTPKRIRACERRLPRIPMPAEFEPEVQLEIGHVLFMDIVGYSKLLINDQREQLRTLNEIVRGSAQFRASDAAGKLVRLPTGDGMALIFPDSVEAPVRCALEISAALKKHPQIQMRIGIHSGPVSEVTDVNERANIAGAGINIAQRVMDCGDAEHILLSKHVAEDLEHLGQWHRHLHHLGEAEVKHGGHVSVVNLYTEELGNPEVPQKFLQARHKAVAAVPLAPEKPSRSRSWMIAAVLVLIGGLAARRYMYSR